MISLTELGRKHGTDKATFHRYTEIYEPILSPLRLEVENVLELGVLSGGSLRMWRDYFPNATIYGVDHLRQWMFEEPRIRTILADLTDPGALKRVLRELPPWLDLVIDDGPHTFRAQQLAINAFSERARIYIVEDAEVEGFADLPSRIPDLEATVHSAPNSNSRGKTVIYL